MTSQTSEKSGSHTETSEALPTHSTIETAIETSCRDAFYIDDSPLWEFPGIQRVAELYIPDPYGIQAEAGRVLDRPNQGRTRRRETQSRVAPVLEELSAALISRIYSSGRVEDAREATLEILRQYPLPSAVDMQGFAADMSYKVEESVRFGAEVQQKTRETIAELHPLVENNPVAQYELSKLFAGDSGGAGTSPRVVLREMAMRTEYAGTGSSLNPWRLVERLGNGDFDGYIAADVLRYETGADEKPNPQYEKIKALATLIQGTNPELSPDEAQCRLVDNLGSWPEPQLQVLAKIRNEQMNKLSLKIGMNRRVQDNPVDQPDAVDAVMSRLGDIIKYEILHQRRPNPPKRRRQPQKEVVPEEPAPPTPEEDVERRTVSYINASGEVFPMGSDEFDAIKRKYLGKFKGAKGLVSDIDAAMEYLSKLRMDTGRPNGVDKYGSKLVCGGQKYDLFAFKPSEAPGFTTHSRLTRETRILFSFAEDGGVMLHGMARRPNVERFVRDLVSAGRTHK